MFAIAESGKAEPAARQVAPPAFAVAGTAQTDTEFYFCKGKQPSGAVVQWLQSLLPVVSHAETMTSSRPKKSTSGNTAQSFSWMPSPVDILHVLEFKCVCVCVCVCA